MRPCRAVRTLLLSNTTNGLVGKLDIIAGLDGAAAVVDGSSTELKRWRDDDDGPLIELGIGQNVSKKLFDEMFSISQYLLSGCSRRRSLFACLFMPSRTLSGAVSGSLFISKYIPGTQTIIVNPMINAILNLRLIICTNSKLLFSVLYVCRIKVGWSSNLNSENSKLDLNWLKYLIFKMNGSVRQGVETGGGDSLARGWKIMTSDGFKCSAGGGEHGGRMNWIQFAADRSLLSLFSLSATGLIAHANWHFAIMLMT